MPTKALAVRPQNSAGPKKLFDPAPFVLERASGDIALALAQGSHVACKPFVKLNASGVQNAAALRYQPW
jgi:hypothetical protein